jgi:hypothetical protein
MTYEEICEYAEENNITINVFENPSYESAIIGLSYDERVIYDMDKMIMDLMIKESLSFEDALEFIEYNTLRALPYMGDGAPIILYTKEF